MKFKREPWARAHTPLSPTRYIYTHNRLLWGPVRVAIQFSQGDGHLDLPEDLLPPSEPFSCTHYTWRRIEYSWIVFIGHITTLLIFSNSKKIIFFFFFHFVCGCDVSNAVCKTISTLLCCQPDVYHQISLFHFVFASLVFLQVNICLFWFLCITSALLLTSFFKRNFFFGETKFCVNIIVYKCIICI